ncbi:Mis6-domain-containing protein [Xylogone sp. PMI_703]|nr:Mis6-domain-containing protein [Xylogone sp. PMI_703]
MAHSPARDSSIGGLIADLETAARIPAKQRAIKISATVDKVCTVAYEDGLSSTSLSKLIDVITLPNELDQATIGNIVRNLYPTDRIPDAVVLNVVASLGHGKAKPSYVTQAALLKWLVMVYGVLENPGLLSQVYSIIFNLIDTIALRPQLCHVLSLITRRRHVRPFRIQMLMEMTRQSGNDPPLVGLMRVYKDYYPDVIVGDATAGRASVFTHPNPEWQQRLVEIQEAHANRNSADLVENQASFRLARKGADDRKRTKLSGLPEVYTSNATESSITLEEIENVSEFVEKLEKIDLPNQIVAVIGDRLMQKFIQLKPAPSTSRRIDNWLMSFFEDQLGDPDGSEPRILAMLAAILDYTRYTKQLPPACLAYIKSMLPTWNGVTGRAVIMDLLVYLPICSFEDLLSVLYPLENAILDDTTESQLDLLNFYRQLLCQWASSILSGDSKERGAIPAISSLISRGSTLALTILQSSFAIQSYSTILDFYDTTVFLISDPELRTTVRITIPPSALIYTLHFTLSLYTISRLSSILAQYKRAFELAMSLKSTDQPPYQKEDVNHFNGFLMDVCNCVWRSRAFNTTDPNSHGCLVSQSTTAALSKYVARIDSSLSLTSLFGLSYAPVLCLLAISYFRELEDAAEEDEIEQRHAGPVTQNSLKELQQEGGLKLSWPDYRLGVLRYLEDKGASGVGELMYNTMKHLMNSREQKA